MWNHQANDPIKYLSVNETARSVCTILYFYRQLLTVLAASNWGLNHFNIIFYLLTWNFPQSFPLLFTQDLVEPMHTITHILRHYMWGYLTVRYFSLLFLILIYKTRFFLSLHPHLTCPSGWLFSQVDLHMRLFIAFPAWEWSHSYPQNSKSHSKFSQLIWLSQWSCPMRWHLCE